MQTTPAPLLAGLPSGDSQHERPAENAPYEELRNQYPCHEPDTIRLAAFCFSQRHPQGKGNDRVAVLDQPRRGKIEDGERIDQPALTNREPRESDAACGQSDQRSKDPSFPVAMPDRLDDPVPDEVVRELAVVVTALQFRECDDQDRYQQEPWILAKFRAELLCARPDLEREKDKEQEQRKIDVPCMKLEVGMPSGYGLGQRDRSVPRPVSKKNGQGERVRPCHPNDVFPAMPGASLPAEAPATRRTTA